MGFRYIGSKEKLANIIIDYILQEIPTAKSVIDLMAGTGNMSLAFRKRGLKVLASDVMTYSYHHLCVQLLLNKSPYFNGLIGIVPKLKYDSYNNYLQVLNFLNNCDGVEGYFFNEFSPNGNPINATKPRCYYTPENAKKIDSLRNIISLWSKNKFITAIEHSLLLHNLIVDSNDIANIAGTYGHYLSHFVKRSQSNLILRPWQFDDSDNIYGHSIKQGYAEEISSALSADVCYIDPPYIRRQYAANYHILETIAREDFPQAIGESGLRPWRDQYSNFCSKVKIRDSFDKIISSIGCNHIFISYSEDGLLSLNQLLEFLSNYGQVKYFSIEYKRFKSNNSKKKNIISEYLIYLHK